MTSTNPSPAADEENHRWSFELPAKPLHTQTIASTTTTACFSVSSSSSSCCANDDDVQVHVDQTPTIQREEQPEQQQAEQSFKISLWLLPSPGDAKRNKLDRMIQKYSSRHATASVPFEPHVTLVGGIPCPSMPFVQEVLLPRLVHGIQQQRNNDDKEEEPQNDSTTAPATKKPSTTKIPCLFDPNPVYQPIWNQACVLVMDEEKNVEYTRLVGTCRDIVASALEDVAVGEDDKASASSFLSNNSSWFPPPCRHPHMSLYYGDMEGVPSAKEVTEGLFEGDDKSQEGEEEVFSFEASQVGVWITEPASAEGVAEWKELCVIDL